MVIWQTAVMHLLPADRGGGGGGGGGGWEPIAVSDLSAATGLHDTTVSQALRHLRAAQIVSTERDGRIIRYLLADHPVRALLAKS